MSSLRKTVLLISLCAPAWAIADPGGQSLFQQVAPILERSCVGCHHGVAARAGLSLDSREGLAKGGDNGPLVDRAKPAESLILQMISGDEPEMPKDAPPLTAAEVELVRRWVEADAFWPEGSILQDKRGGRAWWSLRPLSRPAVPDFDDPEARGWIRNPIDAFVLEKLRGNRLSPSAQANRAALIRRLCFDLIGLPPTPEQLAPFMTDDGPRAYERLVDRLLASPQYGERWARHWLDVAHYGETHGYDKDKRREHSWPYRDYVIQSLNRDRPYAEFVGQQLLTPTLLLA